MVSLEWGSFAPLRKRQMATFERYFVRDKETHKELQNPYYAFRDDESVVRGILSEFGVHPDQGCIVNGHVPVRIKKGQTPVKANGKLIIIDGGMAKAYQKVTGIGGFTLIANSHGILLAEHKPFDSAQRAIQEDVDMESNTTSIYSYPQRMFVEDTDRGVAQKQRIAALKNLLEAYRTGLIKEL